MGTAKSSKWTLERVTPGLAALLSYDRNNLPYDLIPGLSVAAVAIPVAVAYGQLAGFNSIVGLYSSILPLIVYPIFGTPRHLIVGPDSAICALADLYLSLSVTLALSFSTPTGDNAQNPVNLTEIALRICYFCGDTSGEQTTVCRLRILAVGGVKCWRVERSFF